MIVGDFLIWTEYQAASSSLFSQGTYWLSRLQVKLIGDKKCWECWEAGPRCQLSQQFLTLLHLGAQSQYFTFRDTILSLLYLYKIIPRSWLNRNSWTGTLSGPSFSTVLRCPARCCRPSQCSLSHYTLDIYTLFSLDI